jgi:hypothetical protein
MRHLGELRSASRRGEFKRPKRPWVIPLMALTEFTVGAVLVYIGVIILSEVTGASFEYSRVLLAEGFISIVLGVGNVLLGVGLWLLRPWARIALIAYSAVVTGFEVLSAPVGEADLLAVVWEGVLIVGLCLPDVRDAFRRTR